jgi:hypothetical protein
MPLLAPIDLFGDALRVLGILGAAESAPNAEDTELCRRTYNKIIGRWNTRRRFSSFTREEAFTFGTAKQTYTIGATDNVPTPDFVVSRGNAPASILAAQIVMTGLSGPNVQLPLAVINQDQWVLITIPALPATFPNTLYYIRPGGGTLNGTLRPWPSFPTATTYQLDLSWWDQLLEVSADDLTTPIPFADGYDAALTFTIAEWLYGSFPKKSDIAWITSMARAARADIQSVNVPPPKIDTTGGAQGRPSGFNWLTRLPG